MRRDPEHKMDGKRNALFTMRKRSRSMGMQKQTGRWFVDQELRALYSRASLCGMLTFLQLRIGFSLSFQLLLEPIHPCCCSQLQFIVIAFNEYNFHSISYMNIHNLSILLFMDIWVLSSLGLFIIMQLCTFLYISFIPMNIFVGEYIYRNRIAGIQCMCIFNLKEAAPQFPKVIIPIYCRQ